MYENRFNFHVFFTSVMVNAVLMVWHLFPMATPYHPIRVDVSNRERNNMLFINWHNWYFEVAWYPSPAPTPTGSSAGLKFKSPVCKENSIYLSKTIHMRIRLIIHTINANLILHSIVCVIWHCTNCWETYLNDWTTYINVNVIIVWDRNEHYHLAVS